MEREKIKNELESKVIEFLQEVNESNFYYKYDALSDIFIKYRGVLSKQDIFEIFDEKSRFNLNDYQDEVLDDILRRIWRFCPPNQELEWW